MTDEIHIHREDVSIDVTLSRVRAAAGKAQYELDSMVMTDMVPYMPMITSTFIKLTQARSQAMAGTGKVCAAAPPYGRFLYYGKTMVDEKTGSTWARAGAKKVVVSKYKGAKPTRAKEDLSYTTTFNPKVEAEWFEAAKKVNKTKWLRNAAKLFKR